jgi:HEAT repeat protein
MDELTKDEYRIPPQDDRSNAELIREALEMDPDLDNPDYRKTIRLLQYRMDRELLATLTGLCNDSNVNGRILAANTLGQGNVGIQQLTEECTRVLLGLLAGEKNSEVILSIGQSLGHLRASAGVSPLSNLRGHPEAIVRLAVVFGLLCQEAPQAIDTLIELSSDSDRDVRDWATMGLGSMIEIDTPEIRDALANRLSEIDSEIRGEAIVGLAERGDMRMIEPLLKDLRQFPSADLEIGFLTHVAASTAREQARKSGDARWAPLLRRLDELELGCSDQEHHK